MVLIRVNGLIQKKMLVSACMCIEQLVTKLCCGQTEKRKALFLTIKKKNGKRKLCPPQSTLKSLHQDFSDEEGYLNLFAEE